LEKTRLDLFLTKTHPHYSRSQIKKLIEDGFVLIDGQRRKPSFLLHGGEKIEMIRRAPEIPKAEAEAIPLNILYEDEDILVINKEAGMVVHPAPGNARGTIVNAILHHLGVGVVREPPLRPGIVHRLDKGTSGVMVVAKNDSAHKDLSLQFKNRRVEKIYQALVFGKFPHKEGTISRPIGRDATHRRKFSSKTRHAREAVTHFEIIKQYEGTALLRLKPETGRTHQIRVHLSEFHHPIVGDTMYGAKSFLSSIKEERVLELLAAAARPLLHAYELRLTHPRTRERIGFVAPLPTDFKGILESL
jgi:23S rRNA pseudouridine1911/1915/1917 synthase